MFYKKFVSYKGVTPKNNRVYNKTKGKIKTT